MGVSVQPDTPPPQQANPDTLNRSFSSVLDADPGLLQEMNKALGPGTPVVTPKQPQSGGLLSGLWNKTREFAKNNLTPSAIAGSFTPSAVERSAGIIKDAETSAARGVPKAIDAISNTAVGAAVGLSKETGAYKLGRTPEEQDAFLKWWEQPTDKANAFQIGDDNIDKWIGAARPGTLNSLAEGATQFTTGLLALGPVVDALPGAGALASAGKLGAGVVGAVKTGAAQAGAFAPHMQRLSDLLKSSLPADSKLQAMAFLANKPGDSEALGALKNGLEGVVLGSTIEGVLGGLRMLKVQGDPEAVAQAAKETIANVKAAQAQEAAHVVPTGEGDFAVVPTLDESVKATLAKADEYAATVPDMPGAPKEPVAKPPKSVEQTLSEADAYANSIPEQRSVTYDAQGNATIHGPSKIPADAVRFATEAQANNAAVSLDLATKNARLTPGTVTPDDLPAWKQAFDHYQTTQDTRGALDILDRYGINVKYDQAPEEAVSTIKALTDLFSEPSTVARGRPQTWEETRNLAAPLLEDMQVSPEQASAGFQRIFGNAQPLPEQMLAMRMYLWKHADEVRKLARVANVNPENALAQDQLAAGLDAMLDLHAHFTGTKSSTARALQALQMPVGGEAEVAAVKAKPSPEVTPEEQVAAAEATGGQTNATPPEEGSAAAVPEAKKPQIQTASGDVLTLQGPSSTQSNAVTSSMLDQHRAPPTRAATAGLTREEIRSLSNSIFLANGDPGEILAQLRGPKRVLTPPPGADTKTWFAKSWDFIHAARVNAMLAGPKTHIMNATANAVSLLQRPVETYLAGAIKMSPELRQQGADMLGGMWRDIGESWRMASKAFLKGENVLDPGNSQVYNTRPADGVTQDSNLAAPSWLGKIAPSRFLMSSDEFFKQMNYRANVRSQILRQARSEGVTDPQELASRLDGDMKFSFDPEGGAVNPIALQYSRVGTFTNELNYGIGKWLQDGAKDHALVRFIFPFVRTPTNIFRYQWERTPILNAFNRDVQADWAAGGDRRAMVASKTAVGTALYSTAAYLATTQQITGAGPTDPQLRRQWKDAGNQPYSIKIPGTDKWVSYKRADPVLGSFGLVADAAQIHHDLSDNDRQNLSTAILASLMSNLSSKTYMQGATDFADAMSSGNGQTVQKFVEDQALSFVPNILRQVNPDDTQRETRGMVDEFMARTPGFSEKLEPKRNLFGEKIMLAPGYGNRNFNPFTLSGPIKDGDAANELIKLGRAFSMPAETKNGGNINMADRDLYDNGTHQSPYDRMLELLGKPKSGPPLRAQMEKLVSSEQYKNASEGSTYERGGMRWALANGTIQAAQGEAYAQVLNEYPKLQKALMQDAQFKGANLTQGQSGVDALRAKLGGNMLVTPARSP